MLSIARPLELAPCPHPATETKLAPNQNVRLQPNHAHSTTPCSLETCLVRRERCSSHKTDPQDCPCDGGQRAETCCPTSPEPAAPLTLTSVLLISRLDRGAGTVPDNYAVCCATISWQTEPRSPTCERAWPSDGGQRMEHRPRPSTRPSPARRCSRTPPHEGQSCPWRCEARGPPPPGPARAPFELTSNDACNTVP